jgi:LmbE family N-acetylglucosaminyl deacetylase
VIPLIPRIHRVRTTTVFLSPHLDDAVLSCGGLICSQVLAGTRVLVLTIFAGEPRLAGFSPLAAELHLRWGHTENPVAARRQEDRCAASLLGAEFLHLGYLDAIYRADDAGFVYLSDDGLFGSPHGSDEDLASKIATSLSSIDTLEQATLFAPLAVGNHVDHQLVRDAVLAARNLSRRAVFYEDYPYVEQPGYLTRALERIGGAGWKAEVQPLAEECFQAKLEAIAAYRSQLATLFGGAEIMIRRVRDYARTLSSDRGYGERYWRFRGHLQAGPSRTSV